MKKWYKSKTVILNAVAASVAAIDYVQPFIPPQHQPLVFAFVGVANIVLRFSTTLPIK